jgi:hypothetical protein
MKKLTNNFHLTFEPDRLGLSALLRFISNNKSSSVENITKETGIPSGKNSGKVMPFLQYLSGMGMINYIGGMANLTFSLTKLGESVLEEDPLLNTNLTQWILHANMCNAKYGSDIWLTFFDNWKSFEVRDVNRVAKNNCIERKKYTPLLNMYLNENCFGYSKILKKDNMDNYFLRTEAPLISEFFPAYGAICIFFMDSLINNKTQIAINEFENITKFSNIFGWNVQNQDYIYENIAALGYIKINSLVSPKCIQPLISVDKAFEDIYMNVM